ncbi:peptidoglycan DD-metalloendopeptidase family protein [Deferrisoma sp.]
MRRPSDRAIFQALLLAACFLLLARPERLWSSIPPRLPAEIAAPVFAPVVAPELPPVAQVLGDRAEQGLLEAANVRREAGDVGRGENLAAVLGAAGVPAAEVLAFAKALKPVLDPKRMRPGDAYEVWVGPEGRLLRFEYRRSPLEVYRAEARPEGGWRAWKVDVPVERRQKSLVGRVEGSLYESFLAAGADADLVMAFVELFSWDVDFTRETREGDEFRAIYEQLWVGDEFVGNGRILAAQYRGQAGIHTAVYYRSDKTEGYFDPEGRSVRKSFLRSPLRFTRISSRFSLRRRHPILKVVRPHRGVDYAAPRGTPVWSVADGTVRYAGWKGQAGKTVIVRHSRGYETYYNHLSRFAPGIRKGVRVRQGQVIGYVGATGLATGPHLDFRVKKNGRWVNPLTEKYPAGDPVPRAEREAYRAWAAEWVGRLEALAPVLEVAKENRP